MPIVIRGQEIFNRNKSTEKNVFKFEIQKVTRNADALTKSVKAWADCERPIQPAHRSAYFFKFRSRSAHMLCSHLTDTTFGNNNNNNDNNNNNQIFHDAKLTEKSHRRVRWLSKYIFLVT